MKKRYLTTGMAVMLLSFTLTGCGGNSQTLAEYAQSTADVNQDGAAGNGASATVETVTEPDAKPEAEPEAAPAGTGNVKICVYRSSSDSTGLESQDVLIPELKPEYILKELAKVNVVSNETGLRGFSVEESEGKHLRLDLSTEFSAYLNMMGTTGEYQVVGSLVNTFLVSYGAKDILITVEGDTLQTSHAIYDKPLTLFEEQTDQKKPMAYKLLDTAYKQETKEVYYPQFDGMPNRELQDAWNQAIMDIALNNLGKKDTAAYDSYKVDYVIGYSSEEKLSFLFTKKVKIGDKNTKTVFALTFDFVSGKCLRFSDLSDVMETVSHNMANNGYYKIMNSDLDRETYDEYFKDKVTDAGSYREQFLRYDYDLTDLSIKPAGYIYINPNGELEIFMNPVKDLCEDQIEIQTGVNVK